MKLWDYLKKKISDYGERLAFANAGISYADIISFGEIESNKKTLVLCEGETKEKQAIEILKAIAAGQTVVPATKDYGEKQYKLIKELIENTSGEGIDDVAFIMFTSGTTGKPKGVMLTDDNIISNLNYIDTYFNLEGLETICIARPLVHIAILTGELLYALCKGLTIYFYEESFMPQRLLAYLLKNKIDVFCATPTLYQVLAIADKNKIFPVKVGVISGETLTPKASAIISSSFCKTQFYNVYGLTEHSPRVSALLPQDFNKKLGSVGKAIGDVEIKIENNELLVKSQSVMKGYYLEKRKTAEKIIDGWLHTGDKAHYDSEGYLFIDGRIDNMLIKAGINIYPEEIENTIKDIPEIEDCLVFGENTDTGLVICLKYVGTIEIKELRRQMVSILNPNIIPNRIEKVEELARTASGKKIRR